MQIIERLYGLLEIHSESQADVRSAGAAILDALGLKEEDRYSRWFTAAASSACSTTTTLC